MSQLPVKELRIEQRKISGRRINYMTKENHNNQDGGMARGKKSQISLSDHGNRKGFIEGRDNI